MAGEILAVSEIEHSPALNRLLGCPDRQVTLQPWAFLLSCGGVIHSDKYGVRLFL